MNNQEQPKYSRIKSGVPTIMGLQAIKTMVKVPGYKGISKIEGPNKGKMVNEPDTFGFRLVFRAYKDPSAFANERIKGVCGEKSNFQKRIQGMCPAHLGKITDREMASIMVELVNHWYLVTAADGKLAPDGKPYQNIVTVAALPPELRPELSPHEYFDSLGGPKVAPAPNTAEGYLEVFNANRCIREGKPLPLKKPEQQEIKTTGFETMPDAGVIHYWDITDVAPHMLEKAEVLLKKAGGVQIGQFEWETTEIVEPLLKYKRAKPQTDFDKDELGEGF